jgi:hypothetical protein
MMVDEEDGLETVPVCEEAVASSGGGNAHV